MLWSSDHPYITTTRRTRGKRSMPCSTTRRPTSTRSWRETQRGCSSSPALDNIPGRVAARGVASPELSDASTFVISIMPFDADGALDEVATEEPSPARWLAPASVSTSGGGGSGEGHVFSRDSDQAVARDRGRGAREGSGSAMGVGTSNLRRHDRLHRMAARRRNEARPGLLLDQGHGHRPNHQENHRYFRSTSCPPSPSRPRFPHINRLGRPGPTSDARRDVIALQPPHRDQRDEPGLRRPRQRCSTRRATGWQVSTSAVQTWP